MGSDIAGLFDAARLPPIESSIGGAHEPHIDAHRTTHSISGRCRWPTQGPTSRSMSAAEVVPGITLKPAGFFRRPSTGALGNYPPEFAKRGRRPTGLCWPPQHAPARPAGSGVEPGGALLFDAAVSGRLNAPEIEGRARVSAVLR